MKVLLACPRWRAVHPCAEEFMLSVVTAKARPGLQVGRIPGDLLMGCAVYQARDVVCWHALRDGFDVVLFCDADTELDAEQALDLCERVVSEDLAILAAPLMTRGKAGAAGGWNFSLTLRDRGKDVEPSTAQLERLREAVVGRKVWVTDGHAGTGVSAVNVRHLREIPRPWFMPEPDERDREERPTFTTSDDVWFSIRAHRAGKRVGVDFGATKGGHWTALRLSTETSLPALVANLGEFLDKPLVEPVRAEVRS